MMSPSFAVRCGKVLLCTVLVAAAARAQGAPAAAPAQDFAVRLTAAKEALAKLPPGDESKAGRAVLERRIRWLERGVGLERRAALVAPARLARLEQEAEGDHSLRARKVLAPRWRSFDPASFRRAWELEREKADLGREIDALAADLTAFEAEDKQLEEKLDTIEAEAGELAKHTVLLLKNEKEQAAADLAAVQQQLAATGDDAPKGDARVQLDLEQEVLALVLRVAEQVEKQKPKWRDLLASRKKYWLEERGLLQSTRIQPLRGDVAEAKTLLARIDRELLPEIDLPAATRAPVRAVFTRCRDRVGELLEKVAARAARVTETVEADAALVERRLTEARQEVKRALEETEADQQSSEAVLYFKLRMERDDLERALSDLLKDSRWEALPRAISALKSELDAAAEDLASVETRFETELRAALGIARGAMPAAYRAPMKEWIGRERAQGVALVGVIEGGMLTRLQTLSRLHDQRAVLEGGLKDLERRGLFLRDTSKLTWRNLRRVGELWIGEGGTLLAGLARLPGEIWDRGMHASAGGGALRIRLVLALLIGALGIVLTFVFRRRRAHLLAGIAGVAEPERRFVHQLAIAGLGWRASLPCSVGGMLLVCSGITTLSPEDRSLCAAAGELLLVAALWWWFEKICVRPLRPRLRLLRLDDAKARRLHLLSTVGLAFWVLGELGAVTQWLAPDVHGRGAAGALAVLRGGGLLAVLFAFFAMPNLLRQVFPRRDEGGIRLLQGFVMLLMWPARLVLFAALVLWALSYHALAANLGRAVVGVLGAVVAGVITHQTIREEFRFRFFRKETGEQRLAGEYLEIVEFLVSLAVVLVTFSLVQGLDLADWKAFCGTELWRDRAPDSLPVTAGDLLVFGLILFVSFALARRARRTIDAALQDRPPIDKGLRYTLGTITSYSIVVLGVLLAFGRIQLGFERLQWLIAALGVGIGFGLQAIISNFFSGLILLFERPLRVGDVVKVGDTLGEVRKITIRSTTITSFDNIDVIVPNKDFITQAITNWTGTDRDMRSTIEVGVAYGSDLKHVRDVLLETVAKHGRVYKKPAPAVYLVSFGDSSIDFSLRYWTSLDYKLSTFSDLHFAIEAAFAREGIEIPFPQSDIRLKEVPPALAAAAAGDEEPGGAQGEPAARRRRKHRVRTAVTSEPDADVDGGGGDAM